MFRGGAGRRSDARGQTHIDFVVGIVLFLLAFTFVVAAVPQLLAPYDDQATPVVADRVSASLTESLLVGGNDPGVLEPTCVETYFLGTGGAGCTFSTPSLADRSGVDSSYRINVRLTGDVDSDGDGYRDVLCYDGSAVVDCPGDRLEVGSPLPTKDRAVSLDRHLVLLNGEPVTLEVRVW